MNFFKIIIFPFNWTRCTDDEEDSAATHKHQLAIALLATPSPSSSHVGPNVVPSRASDPNAISLQPSPPEHFMMRQLQIECHQSASNGLKPSKTPEPQKGWLAPVALKNWSTSDVFLLFGRGIVLCRYPTCRPQNCWHLRRKLEKSEERSIHTGRLSPLHKVFLVIRN